MHELSRFVFTIVFCLTIPTAEGLSNLRAEDDSAGLDWRSSSVAERSKDIIEAVMEHHIEPPTRQQLVLEVLRVIAIATHQRLAPELSLQISGINDVDTLYSLLREETAQLGLNGQSADWMNEAVLAHLNTIVLGGLKIVPEKEYAVNEQLSANRYVGIGVRAGMDNQAQRTFFPKVIEGGTAESAGVHDGDIVESVDGKDTQGVPLGEVIQWLRGPEGSTVKIVVRSSTTTTKSDGIRGIKDSGDETREIEIVRRIVPLKTMTLVPRIANAEAALVRLDRLSASSVHEIRKIIGDLPESVTTMILDLRFTQEGTVHHLHLLADAMFDECQLGKVETRSGVRSLNSEPGTIFGNRRPVMVFNPGHSAQIDWLAAVTNENGAAVYRDEFNLREIGSAVVPIVPTVNEFVLLSSGNHYIEMATSRLLPDNGRTQIDVGAVGATVTHSAPVSQQIGEPLTRIDEATALIWSLIAPRAIVDHAEDFALRQQPHFARGLVSPADDESLIDQIMTDER